MSEAKRKPHPAPDVVLSPKVQFSVAPQLEVPVVSAPAPKAVVVPAGETKPIYKSNSAWVGLVGMGLLEFADVMKALPDRLIWPFTAIILAVIAQRLFADFGKYSIRPLATVLLEHWKPRPVTIAAETATSEEEAQP